jgi:4-hydroxy-tetrahydrodipicolinate synthase
MAATKLRDLIAAGGDSIEGPWDGEEAITLMADLDAGATGAMTGGGYPDGIRQIVDPYLAGRREEAMAAYARWLPLINWENRQCGLAGRQDPDAGRWRDRLGSGAAPAAKGPPGGACGARSKSLRTLDPVVLRWGR